MPAPVVVVRKDSLDHAPAFDLKVACALLEGAAQNSVAFGCPPALCARGLRREARNTNHEQCEG